MMLRYRKQIRQRLAKATTAQHWENSNVEEITQKPVGENNRKNVIKLQVSKPFRKPIQTKVSKPEKCEVEIQFFC